MSKQARYTIVEGREGSAFGNGQTVTLAHFPDNLWNLSMYLQKNADVVDLAVTRADGTQTIIKRVQEDESDG